MSFFGKKDLTFGEIKELYVKGQLKKAISECEKFIKKFPNDFDALNFLSELYYKSGDRNRFVNHSLEIVKKLENEKYYEKAAAVLRKGIKYFPDQYDFYRYLAKIFEKKGLIADQIGILKDLALHYEKNGNVDRSLDVLKDIFEINKNNYDSLKYLIKKIKSFGKNKEICKYLYYALETSYKSGDSSFLYELIEDGITNGCIFGTAIKYTLDYCKKVGGRISFYIENAKNALMSNFDEELFLQLIDILPFDADKDFYMDIYKRFTNVQIFSTTLDYFISNNDNKSIVEMVRRVRELEKYQFDKKFAEIFFDRVEQLPINEIYDDILVIAKMADHWDLKEKVVSLAGFRDGAEKLSTVSEKLDMDLFQPAANSQSMDLSSLDFIERTEVAENSNISGDSVTNKFDIELDLGEFETGANVSTEMPKVNDNTVKAENIEDENVSDIFELDLTEHIENESTNYDQRVDEVLEETQTVDKKIDDSFLETYEDLSMTALQDESSLISIDFNSDIEEIKSLIKENRKAEAKLKLDELLILDPENEKLKDIALHLYSFDYVEDNSEKIELQKDVLSIDPSLNKIVSAIKKSIEESVSHDDYEMHYDLAQAYMEMDLFEESLEELKKSAFSNLRYNSLTLMAECYKRMGRYDDAIGILKLIILDYGKDGEVLKNAMYDIALNYELKGDVNSSNAHFKKLHSLDPNFRDVSQKILEITGV